jgi:serine/threonine protein kinase
MTDPRPPVADRAPRVLADRFELGAAIGRGGSAIVHRARDRSTGGTVAVKLVDPDALGRERFEREARTLAALAAPGVVRYVAHGCDGDNLFLVEEWLAGASLRAQLAGAGVTAAEAVYVVHAAAVALSVVHSAGIVHRDLKPEHIWLGGEAEAEADGNLVRRDALGRVTLIDFGIARGARDPRVTATGSSLGTPGYMAPEQARGDRTVDARADVFALGAVLFEALTGTAAFLGHSDGSTRAKVLLAAPPALAPRCPEAPPPLIALVEAMLAKHPDHRPAHAGAVALALASITVAPGPRRRASTDALTTTFAHRRRTPSAAPRVFVIAAGHATVDVHQLSALAGTRAMLVDGALWLGVLPGTAGADRAREVAQAWHDLIGTPAAVAAGELDAAIDWVADAVARAALLTEFAAFAAPPASIQLDATTTTLLAAARRAPG